MVVSRSEWRCGVIRFLALSVVLVVVAGCTVHPEGEQRERDLAANEGKRYAVRPDDRLPPTLSADPTPDDLVRYASLASPELEQKYWEWRSAIEQIPQDGTQATNLVLFAGVPITNGSTSFDRTTVTAANDAMNDIQWPSKPTTAAQRALEEARAAGFRFQQAKLNLRQKLLAAYYDYALAAEIVKLEQENGRLLNTSAEVMEAGIASGRSTQAAVLGARNEVELSRSQIIELQSRLPGLRAAVNAAMGREPTGELSPGSLPPARTMTADADDLLRQIALISPELAAEDADVRGKGRAIKLAKLQDVPDFSLSASTDLGGVVQNLSGMVTAPLLRYQAINAAVAQAEANLRATDAMRRQTGIDLRSKMIAAVTTADDLHRQLALLENNVIPRAEAITAINQSAYESGRISFAEMLDSRRSLTALKRLDANLRVSYEERLLDIEAVVGA